MTNRPRKKERALQRQNHRCPWCGKPLLHEHATHEHIIPKIMGGTGAFENMAVAHAVCNRHRSSNIWIDPVPGCGFDFIRQRLALVREGKTAPLYATGKLRSACKTKVPVPESRRAEQLPFTSAWLMKRGYMTH